MTWELHSWSHRSCGCLHETKPVNFLAWSGKWFMSSTPEKVWPVGGFQGCGLRLTDRSPVDVPMCVTIWVAQIGVGWLCFLKRERELGIKKVGVNLRGVMGRGVDWIEYNHTLYEVLKLLIQIIFNVEVSNVEESRGGSAMASRSGVRIFVTGKPLTF